MKGCQDYSNATTKDGVWLSEASSHAARRARRHPKGWLPFFIYIIYLLKDLLALK